MKRTSLIFSGILCTAAGALAQGGTEYLFEPATPLAEAHQRAIAGEVKDYKPFKVTEPAPRDLVSYTQTYTAESDFRSGDHLGKQDALETEVSYGHRFPLFGQWFFRTGLDYDRYDFGRSFRAPVPTHLQSLSVPLSIEYVEQGYVGAALEFHPGVYFENDIEGRNFDVPVDAFATFKLSEKFFLVVGAYYSTKEDPAVVPIGGIIWLINDKLRLEAVFPRSSLVYVANDDWEFRAGAEVDGGGYTIDRDPSRPAELRGATVQYYEERAGVTVTCSKLKPFDISLGAGWVFERRFDYFRTDRDYKTEGAPYVKLSIDAEF